MDDVSVLSNYKGRHEIFLGLNLLKCNSCEMVFASPMPSKAALIDFNNTYFDSAHGGHRKDKSSNAFYSGISRLRSIYLNKYIRVNGHQSTRFLEIGPGPGFFAKNWIKENPESQYCAIETDESCYSSLREIGVELLKEDQYEKCHDSFDIVLMSHVLEHVDDPKGFVSFASKFLKKNGVLFIEVPCNDWEFKPLHEPHLLFFNKGPMRLLLNDLDFDNIQVNYYGQKISSLKNRSFVQEKMRSLRTRLVNLGFDKIFGNTESGMESIEDSYERAIVKPFMAHIESSEPTWWLRAVASKK